jgi:hypothetical protein
MAIPSFSKNTGLLIEKKKNKYFIISITFIRSYWRAKNRNGLSLLRKE